jgi:lipid II:glycine glycyltransferase (peptidoglycan interpeptide bridge formation enzyme)
MPDCRKPSEDELEDYRVQELDRIAKRKRVFQHSYDPTCGCPTCEPEDEEDED